MAPPLNTSLTASVLENTQVRLFEVRWKTVPDHSPGPAAANAQYAFY